jgi:hypothetical protein
MFAEFSSKCRKRFSHLRVGSENCTVVPISTQGGIGGLLEWWVADEHNDEPLAPAERTELACAGKWPSKRKTSRS